MSGGLRYTLVVVHPDTGMPVALLAGEPVPEWAESLVQDDDYAKPEPEPEDHPEPAGNASTEAWAAYAVRNGADPASVVGKSRDDLKAEFGTK